MQIYMKPTREERDDLLGRMRAAIASAGLSYAALADLAEVDASQVSRICRGEFATFSDSVVRICAILGVNVPRPGSARRTAPTSRGRPDPNWIMLERSVRRAWDSSPMGAERLARVIAAVGHLRDR